MEDASRQRKERLEALKKRKYVSEGVAETDDDAGSEKLALKFRNYTPINEEIKSKSKINIATSDEIGETLEKKAEEITKEVKAVEEAKREEEVDLFNLAPKRPNWDLKRDVEQKLAKLEKKTQASIAQLIRMRLQGESQGGDNANDPPVNLVDAVKAQQIADSGKHDLE